MNKLKHLADWVKDELVFVVGLLAFMMVECLLYAVEIIDAIEKKVRKYDHSIKRKHRS